jgi:hypothetical protein
MNTIRVEACRCGWIGAWDDSPNLRNANLIEFHLGGQAMLFNLKVTDNDESRSMICIFICLVIERSDDKLIIKRNE